MRDGLEEESRVATLLGHCSRAKRSRSRRWMRTLGRVAVVMALGMVLQKAAELRAQE